MYVEKLSTGEVAYILQLLKLFFTNTLQFIQTQALPLLHQQDGIMQEADYLVRAMLNIGQDLDGPDKRQPLLRRVADHLNVHSILKTVVFIVV